MGNKVAKIEDEALIEGKCEMCLTCDHSYFRKGQYDGYCRFAESHRDISYPKNIFIYDVCEHWEEKTFNDQP